MTRKANSESHANDKAQVPYAFSLDLAECLLKKNMGWVKPDTCKN